MSLLVVIAGYYRQLVDATKELFIRILMSILIFLGYVLLSLFIYAVMRRIMVPQKLHVVPIHLRYDSKCLVSHPDIRHVSECAFPRADLVLNEGSKLLRSGHRYHVLLEFELPDSDRNSETGVFMVNLTFYSSNNRYVTSASRPTMVHFKSSLLKMMHALFYALPLLLGVMEQKQHLELVLFENYYEAYGDGTLSATVLVETHGLHLYSSRLVFTADFSGFTYYLYQWPLSMSVIVVISILITLCTCTLLLWVRDVIHDLEERRGIGVGRRRQVAQTIRPRPGGRGQLQEHRQEGQRLPPERTAIRDPQSSEGEPTTIGRGSGQSGETTPTSTRESSVMEFGEVIHSLHHLRQELDLEDQYSTSDSTEGPEVRHRTVPSPSQET